jgi:type IV secretory pathway VirB4 component
MAIDATQAGKTQEFVPVKEIRDGVIILKDGGYRGVLICSAINFALKSAEEQQAITLGFQNFLNTLDFSIQILINSRRMDLRPYIALLQEKATEQKSELMRIQLREYIEFISSFTDRSNIMTKSFYVVVSYAPQVSAAGAVSFLSRTTPQSAASTATFEENRAQLEQRMSLVTEGLTGTGVRAVPLGTEEAIELLYRAFNPGELENPIRLDT